MLLEIQLSIIIDCGYSFLFFLKVILAFFSHLEALYQLPVLLMPSDTLSGQYPIRSIMLHD